MSAAAARHRKQLAARSQAADASNVDMVAKQLQDLLSNETLDEPTAYEALQLAQSQVRKKIKAGLFDQATMLCFETALCLLQKSRVSVASQLLTLLVETLQETHTNDSDEWRRRIHHLNDAHATAMSALQATYNNNENNTNEIIETLRLERLQRDFLRDCCHWSSRVGTWRYGHNDLHKLLGNKCFAIATLEEDEDERMDSYCDAVQHMVLAEDPDTLAQWLQSLPAPTPEQTRAGHTCAPALCDALLTRACIMFCAMENLRDANALVRMYVNQVETRTAADLARSYTAKDDGQAPSHAMFCCMLVRTCEKDAARTGQLYQWLLRSFKKELDLLYKPQIVAGFATRIGKVYFNIQPPPNMLSMVESMMGGGVGAGGGQAQMMQAMMAQLGNMQ